MSDVKLYKYFQNLDLLNVDYEHYLNVRQEVVNRGYEVADILECSEYGQSTNFEDSYYDQFK